MITNLQLDKDDFLITFKDTNGKVHSKQLDDYIVQLAEMQGCNFDDLKLIEVEARLERALNYIEKNLRRQ